MTRPISLEDAVEKAAAALREQDYDAALLCIAFLVVHIQEQRVRWRK